MRLSFRLSLAYIHNESTEDKDVGDKFHLYLTISSYSIHLTSIILFNSFEPTIGRNIVNYLSVLFGTLLITLGLYKHDHIKSFDVHLIVGWCVMIYIMRLMQQLNLGSIQNFIQWKEQKNMFEMIVENIGESLVIIEKSKMQLANS